MSTTLHCLSRWPPTGSPTTRMKYPAELVEKLRAALNEADVDFSAREQRADAGGGDMEPGDWFTFIAAAALDALGLTVTEEWAARSRGLLATYPASSEADARTIGDPMKRTVLHAETPWEVVTDE